MRASSGLRHRLEPVEDHSTVSFPRNGFVIRIDELPELKWDDMEREFTARVNIPAGEEYRFAFDLLAPRSEVGGTLSSHIEVRNLLAHDLVAARWNSDVSIKITSVPTKGGIVIGGLKFNPPPIGLAVWMICAVVMFVWMRSRMKWIAKVTTRFPEFALKYQAGEREVISSGFDTGSSINIGSQITGKAAIDELVAGQTIPCWYDPADPAIVVVRRGFGGAILFYGLLPLPFLWFGLRQLRKVSRAIRQLDELESAVS